MAFSVSGRIVSDPLSGGSDGNAGADGDVCCAKGTNVAIATNSDVTRMADREDINALKYTPTQSACAAHIVQVDVARQRVVLRCATNTRRTSGHRIDRE
jgi:hypothetical protein